MQGIPKVYRAFLTQSGTDAPTAVVLENTLGGHVAWSRDDVGSYLGTAKGRFPVGKTFISGPLLARVFTQVEAYASAGDVNSVAVQTRDGGVLADSILADTPIEVLVYP